MVETGGIWLELKRDESQEPEEAQAEMNRRLNAKGSRAFIVRSWNEWTELKKKLGIYEKSLRYS